MEVDAPELHHVPRCFANSLDRCSVAKSPAADRHRSRSGPHDHSQCVVREQQSVELLFHPLWGLTSEHHGAIHLSAIAQVSLEFIEGSFFLPPLVIEIGELLGQHALVEDSHKQPNRLLPSLQLVGDLAKSPRAWHVWPSPSKVPREIDLDDAVAVADGLHATHLPTTFRSHDEVSTSPDMKIP